MKTAIIGKRSLVALAAMDVLNSVHAQDKKENMERIKMQIADIAESEPVIITDPHKHKYGRGPKKPEYYPIGHVSIGSYKFKSKKK